jgi:L-lactate dehydrogenase complex protein LldE
VPIAKHTIGLFEGYDFLVVPSGSCAGMIARHYPLLLADDPVWQPRAQDLATKTYELTRFLREVMDYRVPAGRLAPLEGVRVGYHDSCSCLREAGVRQQPRELLRQGGVEVVDLEQAEVCCGFGGTFSTKLPAISVQMADAKLADVEATGADLLVAADLGCLFHLGGRVSRRAGTLPLRHVAELLAGRSDVPPLGGGGGV